jgi:hypothetical protein
MADITTSATIVSTTTGAPITTTGAPITTTGAPITTTAAPVVSGVENDLAKNDSTVNKKPFFNYVNNTNKILFYTSLSLVIIIIIIGILNKYFIPVTKYVNKIIILIYLIISLIISIVSVVLLFLRTEKMDKEIQQSKLKEETYDENDGTSIVMKVVNIILIILNLAFIVTSFEKL